MRYAVIESIGNTVSMHSSYTGTIKDGRAFIYINNKLVVTSRAVYEENGIHLIESTDNGLYRNTPYFYRLFLPETHPYYNYGVLNDEVRYLRGVKAYMFNNVEQLVSNYFRKIYKRMKRKYKAQLK